MLSLTRAVACAVALLSVAVAAPIPDYAPVEHIVVHEQLDVLAPQFMRTLARHLGKRLQIESYDLPPSLSLDSGADADESDTTLVWMRDYQLLYSRDAQGHRKGWRYLSMNLNRTLYRPEPDLETLPLVHENGNLVVVGDRVFVGERLVEENDGRLAGEPDLAGRPYKARSRGEVVATLAKALGVPASKVSVFDPLPSEATGHVDLFLLPLDDRTVLVPQISARDLKPLRELHQLALATEAREHLDAAAQRVERMGLRVVRVPMLPPFLWRAVDAEPEDAAAPQDAVYYSPANTLLVNLGKGRKLAFLPRLSDRAVPKALHGLSARYTRATARALRKHGWRPVVVDATDLGRWLGLFRCVTASIPAR